MLILKVLNKKVHSNPKYAGVKGTISTGKTVKDVATVSKWFHSVILLKATNSLPTQEWEV